ncbi:hypothetical protein M378DRAFT_383958 [Amanita muscaria Koide BX008]|uniref:Uncharacterized protein n=1 Tax=Amanita muscaria (strain Koide BX008) TaxID=946122 RepID=A0A0C2W8C6_AMAMK|nr:hypothetical protein M378DRAFT_383958 [Amanita muscaria Koide BX008]
MGFMWLDCPQINGLVALCFEPTVEHYKETVHFGSSALTVAHKTSDKDIKTFLTNLCSNRTAKLMNGGFVKRGTSSQKYK